jgi:hypothetical protein
MKRKVFDLQKLAATAIFLVLFLSGCNKDSDDKGRIEILIVSSELVPNGTNPSTTTLVNVMELTKENSNTKYYLALGTIEGFEYTEGYEYKLKVQIVPIENPPMDGYTEMFKLIEIISTTERNKPQ